MDHLHLPAATPASLPGASAIARIKIWRFLFATVQADTHLTGNRLRRMTETFVFIPMTSCPNLSTSQKCLSASCTRKHFICFTDFPIGQVRNIGLVLCTRDESTDYLTSLLTHMHTGVWVCKSSKPIISWMISRVRAVVSWGLVKGNQEKKIFLSILFWFQMKNEINLE